MATETCTSTCPTAALLARIVELLKDGPEDVPDFPESPYVVGFSSGVAPANHFLLPQGTRVYSGDIPACRDLPCALVWCHQRGQPTHENSELFWDVPVTIQLRFDRSRTVADLEVTCELLETLFLTDYAAVDDYEGETAAQRLSSDTIRVRNLFDRDVSPFTTEDGENIVQLVFTAFCSGKSQA